MKTIHIVALVLPVLLNACAPKKSAEASAPAAAALETDGVEYCSILANNDTPTCFLEMKSGGKSEYVTTGASYQELLLSPSFADQNITFKQVEEAEYSKNMLENVIPTVAVKEQDIKLVLDPVGTDDANIRKAPGRTSSFGSLGRINSGVFKASSGTKLKSFLRSFTKGFSGAGGKLSPKRLAAGGLTVLSGVLGLVGFGNWAKDKAANSRPSLDRNAINDLEISVVQPTAYKIED